MLMRTEFIATMHENNFLGNRFKHKSPVYCRIASAADQNLPAFKFIQIANEIMKIAFFEMSRIF
ncbi:hypothetical protein D3C76_1363280 [compost metagenome]